jgi:hypothetical protein
MPTVDGHRWVDERLRFLRELLEKDPEHEDREAILAEIEQLKASVYAPKHRWRRFLGLPR